jgi:hypothetical protein
VLPHGVHDGGAERAARFVGVAAHGAAIELDFLILDVLLEPVMRHAERKLLHHEEGDD